MSGIGPRSRVVPEKKRTYTICFFIPPFSRFILRLTIDRGKIAKTATDEVAEGDGVRWGFR